MDNEIVENEPLEAVAEKITQLATAADEKTIEAAILVREARERVEAGEAGETTWYSWAHTNIKLSESRLRELQRIAEAEDPHKELVRIREMNRKRVQRHREKKTSAPLRNGGAVVKETATVEDSRHRLIEWARSAPLDHVGKVLSYIEQFDPAETPSESSLPSETAAAA